MNLSHSLSPVLTRKLRHDTCRNIPFLWCELHRAFVGLWLSPRVFNLSSTGMILFLPLGCRSDHSNSLLKAIKMQTIGCDVLKQSLSLRTPTDNYCCSLSGWWCWTTSFATLVSSQGCSHALRQTPEDEGAWRSVGTRVCRNLVRMWFSVLPSGGIRWAMTPGIFFSLKYTGELEFIRPDQINM